MFHAFVRCLSASSNRSKGPQGHPRLGIESLDDRCLLDATPLQVLATAPPVVARGESINLSLLTTGIVQPTVVHYVIDWNNDGVNDEVLLNQLPGINVSHTFKQAGDVSVKVWAGDPATGWTATTIFNTSAQYWRLAPNTSAPDKTDLIIGGSAGDDFIMLYPGSTFNPSATPDVVGFFQSTDPSGFQVATGVTGAIIVYAGDGNDYVFGDMTLYGATTHLVQSLRLYGGAGDDFLLGGVMGDLLDGGDGSDVAFGGITEEDAGDLILGGNGRDILFGGAGGDYIIGGSGEDIVISGLPNTAIPGWTALNMRGHWSQTAYIAGVLGSNQSGEYLRLKDDGPGFPQTVFDDFDSDTLVGGQGVDWFIRAFAEDVVVDLAFDEFLQGWNYAP